MSPDRTSGPFGVLQRMLDPEATGLSAEKGFTFQAARQGAWRQSSDQSPQIKA